MQIKPKPRSVALIKGATSKELTDRCPDLRKTFPLAPCSNSDCPWSVDSTSYMNCSFVASEAVALSTDDDGFGFSLEEIGEMMDLTREGVRLIQAKALAKIRKAMDELDKPKNNDIAAVHESHVAPGPRRVSTSDQADEREDQGRIIRVIVC